MKKRIQLSIFVLVFASLSFELVANIDLYQFSNEANELRYKELTKELRCPKCQNQDIADSNAPIAKDMRREVHRLLEEGEDNQFIVEYMVDRFGEFVSYKPKVKPETYLLWYGPWVLLVLGLISILFMASRTSVKKQNDRKEKSVDKEAAPFLQEKAQQQEIKQLLSRYNDDD